MENKTKGAPPIPESTRRKILTDALKLYDQLVAQAGDSVKAKIWAGETSARVAKLREQIGDLKAARDSHERAIELLTEVVKQEPTVEHRDKLGWQCHGAAVFCRNFGDRDPARAAELFRRGLSIYSELLKENLTDAQRRRFELRYAFALNNVAGSIYPDAKRSHQALDLWNQVLQLAGRIGAPLDEGKAFALWGKANHLSKTSPADADALYQEVIEIWRRAAVSSGYTQYRAGTLTNHLVNYAVYLESRAPEKAKALYDEAATVRRRLIADYPAEVSFVTGLVDVLEREGNFLRGLAERAEPMLDVTDFRPNDDHPVSDRPGVASSTIPLSAEAESLLNEAAALRRQLASDDPADPNRHSIVDFLANQARALRRSAASLAKQEPQKAAEQLDEAGQHFRRAIAAQRERLIDSGDANHRVLLFALLTEQAAFLREQGGGDMTVNAAAAVKLTEEAIELGQLLVKDFPDNFDHKDRLATTLLLHANVLHNLDPVSAATKCLEAEDLLWRNYRELKARQNELPEPATDSFTRSLTRLVDHYASSGKGVKDESLARELLAECQRHFGDDDRRTAHAAEWVAWCLYHEKRFCEAEPYFRQYVDWSEMHLPMWWGTSNRMSFLGGFISAAASELRATDPAAANEKLVEAEELLLRSSRELISREKEIPHDWKNCVTQSMQRLVDVYIEVTKRGIARKVPDAAAARKLQVNALVTDAIQLYRGLAAEFPDNAEYKNRLTDLLKLQAQHFGQMPSPNP